jgi:hypothetical protein
MERDEEFAVGTLEAVVALGVSAFDRFGCECLVAVRALDLERLVV